jgi:sugar/nucleoside kinase (ribokinase family)
MMFGEKRGDPELVAEAGRFCALALMKVGREGCYLNDGGRVDRVPGFPARAMDTTAAGDCFAAGFLYGRLTGRPSRAAAVLANRLASAIVTVRGCDFAPLDPHPILREGR